MRLEGFRCDECGTESREKPGQWTEVRSMNVSTQGAWSVQPMMSDGLHYCSKDCLLTAIHTKWQTR